MANSNYPIDQRLALFPISAAIHSEKNSLQIGGLELGRLAEEYGTPLYIYDQATILDAVQRYRQALDREYPAASGLTYAGKAYLCLAIAHWMSAQGIKIDCSGASELHIVKQAGVPRELTVQHGVNKRRQDILAGIRQAGILVVDHMEELIMLREQFRSGLTTFPEIWLRWRPGLSVETHSHVQTARAESKFGFSSEEIFQAVRLCLESSLPLTGLHFHLGSNMQEFNPA